MVYFWPLYLVHLFIYLSLSLTRILDNYSFILSLEVRYIFSNYARPIQDFLNYSDVFINIEIPGKAYQFLYNISLYNKRNGIYNDI